MEKKETNFVKLKNENDEHEFFIFNKLKKAALVVKKNSKVLDVGCHNGRLLKFLPPCDYFGIDINPLFIRQLKHKGISAEQIDLNKEEIPFQEEKFDYIFLLDILEHILDPRNLLNDIKKRLKEGGKVIISLPNDYHLLNKIRFIFNKSLTKDSFDPCGHLHFFPIKQGESLLTNQRFKILEKHFLAPTKPALIPRFLKENLSKFFPQTFARNIIYTTEPD